MSLDDLSDAELVRRFKSGDSLAFDAIVRRFQDRVFRLASVWLHDSQHAGDVSQEVFLRAFQGLRGFRFRAAPFTWLYRVTRNVCNEFNRRRVPEPLEQEPIDYESLPDAQLFHSETARRVRELVDVLPARQREVVLLRVFEELSVKDTASAMGCLEGTVKALLHKANQSLRNKMEKSELVS